ncbi:MAG: hypothetical protein COB85_06425 [Bacteroidetes bacterium]|nr:MAG: hypothetical protein COB85_06425 [Bacteroidota bacterium]
MVINIKSFGFRFSIIIAFLVWSLIGFSQEAEIIKTTEEQSYVKIEIGFMGLHCPFLGNSLKDKLKNEEKFSNLFIDEKDTFLTFSFDKSLQLTESELVDIPKNVGYSEEIITVTISDVPFSIDQ